MVSFMPLYVKIKKRRWSTLLKEVITIAANFKLGGFKMLLYIILYPFKKSSVIKNYLDFPETYP